MQDSIQTVFNILVKMGVSFYPKPKLIQKRHNLYTRLKTELKQKLLHVRFRFTSTTVIPKSKLQTSIFLISNNHIVISYQ